jgi:hypothetical protein
MKVMIKQDGEHYGKVGKLVDMREIEINHVETGKLAEMTIYFVEFDNNTRFIFNANDVVCLGEYK